MGFIAILIGASRPIVSERPGYPPPYLSMGNSIYESRARKVFDYNQFRIKILTGVRGAGKTYPVHEHILNKYFKKGEYFVLVRETQEEVDNMLAGAFWDSYLLDDKKYKGHQYTTMGNKVIIDGIIVGYAVALSTYGKFRGAVSPVGQRAVKSRREQELEEQIEEMEEFVKNNIEKTTTAFFDEFIPLTPKMSDDKRYHGFLHFLETVFRFRRNCMVILCGNITKPYDIFLENFNFKQPLDISYGIKKSYTIYKPNYPIKPLAVWCHIKPNPKWLAAREESIVGMITRGKEEDMFSTGNAYVNTDVRYITGKPDKRKAMYNLSDGERRVTFWKSLERNKYYITEPTRNNYTTYVFDIKLCRTGNRLILKSLETAIVEIFESGLIEFENAKVFDTFVNILPTKRSKK